MTIKKRQLAAIMFTDIVGFTTMMGRDENKTLELLHNNRDLQKPLIEKHGGRWLKEMGDGVLASFKSAYQAVDCAIEIQQTANEDLRNKIRIGIHLGDVTFEEKDVFGAGVNIASRLESIADPGSIYISEAIYNVIRGKKGITAQYLGELQLKNVENKIGTYAISLEGLSLPSRKKIKALSKAGSKTRTSFNSMIIYIFIVGFLILGSWILWNKFYVNKTDSIQSLAVLPFSNYTGDESQESLTAGIHDALISELGQLGIIRVIAKQSTLQYANSEKTIKEIASELNVDAIIEASILSATDSIRVQLKLINAYPEEKQIWSQTFDSDMSNILNLYGNITKNIANEIQLSLSPEQQIRLDKTRQVNPRAHKAYLNGRFNLAILTPEKIEVAEKYFLKAVEIDSLFAPAYGGLSGIWIVKKQLSQVPPEVADPKIEEYLEKAFKLDSTDAEVWRWYASKLGNTDFNWKACNRAMEKCLQINPNYSEARAFYAHFLMIQNRWDEAWEQMNSAMELDPLHPLVQNFRGILLIHSGRYDEYLSIFEPLDNPGFANVGLFIVYSLTNQYDKAITQLKKLNKASGHEDLIKILDETGDDFSLALNLTADAMAEISDSTYVSPNAILLLYALADNREKTLYWLEKMYIRKDPNLPYWAVDGQLTAVYQNEPRYIEIMKRINLR